MAMRWTRTVGLGLLAAVLVFLNADRSDSQVANVLLRILDTPNPQAGAGFGEFFSVATGDLDGDGKADIVIGAPGETVGGIDSQGRVYVFSGATGALMRTFDTPDPQAGGAFGFALATGDVNSDGRADVAVLQGRVYIFSGADGSLIRTLDAPNPQPGAEFGVPLAMGDVNGDGSADVVAGARREVVAGNVDQGRAYVFSGATGSLLFTLNTPNPQPGSFFGVSVGVGDMDLDARADLAVGAGGEDVGANVDQGRAYVFSGATGMLIRTLDDPNPQIGILFGRDVGMGDANGDGRADVSVGAPGDAAAPGPPQHAYVFSGADGSVLFTLNSPNPQAGAEFSHGLAMADVNGDGKADLLTGARYEDVGGNGDQGQAYVFSGSDGSVLFRLDTGTSQTSAHFGGAVAMGDVDGDGKAEVAVGAPTENVGGNVSQGRVYLFAGDIDGDGIPDGLDNCPLQPNPGDVDCDRVGDIDEPPCGSDPLDGTKRPERIDGAFAGVDDDGDTLIDEALPGGAEAFDCDGDGYKGSAEFGTPLCENGVNDDDKVGVALIADDAVIDDGCPGGPAQVGAFSEAQFFIGLGDQDPCGLNGWPSDFITGGVPLSTNKINVLDLTSFIAPVALKRLNTAPGQPTFDKRWDLIPGRGVFTPMINVTDLTALIAASSGFPPMLGGVKAFSGPSCPWPP